MPSGYKRGYNYEQFAYVQAPTGGWNPDAPPHELPETQSPMLDNLLVRPGKVVMRGGFYVSGDFNAYNPLDVCGYIPSGSLVIARRANGSAAVDPWNAPTLGSASALLATGNTTLLVLRNGVVTTQAATANQIPGPRWLNYNGQLYGLAYDSTSAAIQDVNTTYFMKPTALLTFGMVPAPGQQTHDSAARVDDASYGIGGAVPWAWFGGQSAWTWSNSTAGAITSHYLRTSAHGFAIPANATITGIVVNIARLSSNGHTFTDSSVRLCKAGAAVGADKSAGAVWTQQHAYSDPFPITGFGTSTDMWGTTWTPAEINAAGFGVALSALDNTGNGSGYVRDMSITVYYSAPATVAAPVVIANAPHGAIDLKIYQNRLWLLGGVDTPGAGTTHSATKLFFTNPTVTIPDTAALWRDPVSNLTNQIDVDPNGADSGVGLAVCRSGLLILRRNSVWILRGSTSSTYIVQPVSRETGCLDPRSIVEVDTGVYFIGPKGLMETNGTNVVNVSGTVMYTLQAAIQAQQSAVFNGAGGSITCATTSQGQLFVSVAARTAGGRVAPLWNGLFDPTTKTWSRITSHLWATDGVQTGTNNYPGLLVNSIGSVKYLVALGDLYATTLEDQSANYSFTTRQDLYDRATVPGNPTPYHPIPAQWVTRLNSASAINGRRMQPKRFWLDHVFASSAAGTTGGWSVVPIDASSAPVGTTMNTVSIASTASGSVSGVSTTAALAIQHQSQDWSAEVVDAGFAVRWTDPATDVPVSASPSNVVAEIYGVGLEHQTTRDLR